MATFAFIYTREARPGLSSRDRDKMKLNADGSVDIYFGPNAPADKENQWVKTIPGKGWFTYVRVYGPEEPLFDGSYKLPDIEKQK